MKEVNLLDSYPRGKRPLSDNRAGDPKNKAIAKRFDREYFDGDRTTGYGGYRYDGRWVPVAKRICDYYNLKPGARVLDVGGAKGFLLHDILQIVPGINVFGLDVSHYAVEQSMESVKGGMVVGTARDLPFQDRSFDLVVSINTIHNLPPDECLTAVREIQRVSSAHKYIQVDSWLDDAQRENISKWVITAETLYEPDGWRALFQKAGYNGDYFWTLTETE